MNDFKVTIHENDGSRKSIDKFEKVFSDTEVSGALVGKFEQAKGAYVVQGYFDSKYISLDTRIARELWTVSNRRHHYDKDYLIIVKPDDSSNLEHATFVVPYEKMKELIVVKSNYIAIEADHIRGAAMNFKPPCFHLDRICECHDQNSNNRLSDSSDAGSESWILGDHGDDFLVGDSNNNYLTGYEGDDALNGGKGRNWLFGGHGKDRFTIAYGMDVIRDKDGGLIDFSSDVYTNSPETFTVTKDGFDLIVSEKKDLKSSPYNVRVLDFFQNKERFTFAAAGKKYKLDKTNGQYKLALATK